MKKIEGRVWKFGDDVNTDQIIPGKYLDNYDPAHLASHAMEGARKGFASEVSPGDVVIAGSNFGCGSSREQAVVSLKHAGVGAVVAQSFARIFYRNAVNLGFYVVVSPDAWQVFEDGNRVVLDLEALTLESQDGRRRATLEPIPERTRRILEEGGLVQHIRARLQGRI